MAFLFSFAVYSLLGFTRFRALASVVFPQASALDARDQYLLQQPGVLHAAAAYIVPLFALQILLMMLFEAFVFLLPPFYRAFVAMQTRRQEEIKMQEIGRHEAKMQELSEGSPK